MQELVSFIIPTFNNETTLRDCLESIMKQAVKKEIIAVDGGSTDRTVDILEEFDVQLIVERKRGIGIARNRGAEAARGHFLAFVDADAVLPEDWASRALHILRNSEPNVAGCAGPVMSIQRNVIGRSLDALCFGRPRTGTWSYVNALNTTGVMFRMDIFREIKFDEHFKRGEDTELGFRMRQAGYKLLVDESLYVYHHQPATMGELARKWFTYGKSYPLSYMKHAWMRGKGFYGRIVFMPLFCLFVVGSLLWPPALWLALVQMFILFLSYVNVGLQMPAKRRSVDIISFSLIHTVKQLSQLTGIWAGIMERRSIKVK